MPENTLWVQIKTPNLEERKRLEEIIASVDGYKVQGPGHKGPTDLLILELGQDAEKELRQIEELLGSGLVGEVFLTSSTVDQPLLLKAMRAGVKEFLLQPLKEEDVRQALSRFRKRMKSSGRQASARSIPRRIIDIIGTNGGVGTTTIAVNLAVSIAMGKSHPSVALVDMNMLTGTLPMFLGLTPNYHWGELANNIDRLDSTFLMSILSRHPSGVHVLASPSRLISYTVAAPEFIEHLLGLMQGMFDFVVIDGGLFFSETSLKVVEMSDDVLLVTVLSLPYLHNANKILTSISNTRPLVIERIKIIVNRYLENSDISLKEAEDVLKKKIFWTIPNDYRTTMSAINHGEPLSQFAPRASITRNIKELTSLLITGERKLEEKEERNLFGFLKIGRLRG